jgi:hypothetical protein
MYQYDTVTEAVNGLKRRGFNLDFNLNFNCLVCGENSVTLPPEEFEITEVHRFEGDSDPADEAVVFAIESMHGLKGVLVNGYGVSADKMSNEMIQKLSIKH